MRGAVLAGIAMLSFGYGRYACAADVGLQVKGTETVEHNSNPLLLGSGAKAVTGSVTSPEVVISDDTPMEHLDLDQRVDLNWFNLPGFTSVDSHSQFHSKATGELVFGSLNGVLDYDTTRTSEAATSGVNTAGIRHTGITASPQAGLNLSAADQAILNGSYFRSVYTNTVLYTDYDVFGLSPVYQHAFDSLNTGAAFIQTSHFVTTTGPRVTFDVIGPQIEWIHKFAQTYSATGSVGYQETSSTFPATITNSATTSRRWDYVYSIDLGYTGQQDKTHFTSTRTSTPSGLGTESLTTSFTATESHSVTARVALELSLSYQRENYTVQIPGVQRSLAGVVPDIRFHLTRTVDLVPTYSYQRQAVLGSAISATSQAFLVHLTYTGNETQFGW